MSINDFRNTRGVNAEDPIYDKDVVNLRTLRRIINGSTSGGGGTSGTSGISGTSGTRGTSGTSGSGGTSGTSGSSGINITISNNVDNRILTATGLVDNISAEPNATFDGNTLSLTKTSTSPNIILDDTSTNDPFIRFIPSTTTNGFAIGIDDSDGDKFKISYGSNAVLGTNDRIIIDSAGDVGIGVTDPTAYLHLKAGLNTAGNAPLKFTTGTLNSTPEAGAMEYSSPGLYFTNGGARRMEIPQILQAISPSDTRTNTTTLSNISGLSVPLLSGKIYRIEAFLYTATVSGVGLRADLFYNGGAITTFQGETVMINGTTIVARAANATTLAASLVNVANITNASIRFTAYFQPNSSNNLTVRAAQSVSAGDTSFISIGSYLLVTEVT